MENQKGCLIIGALLLFLTVVMVNIIGNTTLGSPGFYVVLVVIALIVIGRIIIIYMD